MKKFSWALFVGFSILIGIYPGIYFLIDRKFGLLSFKTPELLDHFFWNLGFYSHILLGGLSLLVGWVQFSQKIRESHTQIHRLFGKIYIISVLVSAMAGFYIGIFATGGIVSSLGFMSLAIIWFWVTLVGYLKVRQGNFKSHENWMIHSYACTFAAVTLRIWLPILEALLGDFHSAYRIVAWICWVPNLMIANWMVQRRKNP